MSELPPSWERCPLDEVNDPGRPICYGILMPGPDLADGVPYIKVRNIRNERIVLEGVHRTSGAIDEKYARSRLRSGDLLVSIRGTFGRTAAVPDELHGANITQDTARVAPLGMRAAYVLRYLQSPDAQTFFKGVARGVAVKGVNIGDLRQLPVPIAPLEEQERIVAAIEEAFSKLDVGEAALRTARQRLKRMRDAVLTAAVTGRLVPQDPTDTPASKLLADLGVAALDPTDDLPLIPATWQWLALGQASDVVGGVTKDAKRQDDPAFVEVPYLRVANVQRGYLDLANVSTIRVPHSKATQLALQPGDVLFNEGGDRDKLGRGWVWRGEIPDCIHQNHVFRARLSAAIEPQLVSWWGNTFGKGWFEGRGKQTTNLASLNLTTLKSFPIPVPPEQERPRIVEEVDRQLSFIEASERAVDAGLARSAALRRSVLKAAFDGRLVPQDPSDDPASVLLERIREERAAQAGPRAHRRVIRR